MTALERKQKTEKLLETLGIPIPHELPPMEEEGVVNLKTPQEIAERILILSYLNCIIAGQDLREEIVNFLKEEQLWEKASETEKDLFNKAELTDEEVTLITWRSESIWTLLWTINKVDELDLPATEVNPHYIFECLPPFMNSTSDFVDSATLRPRSEILDQSDFIFRLNWAIRQAQSNGSNELDLNQSIAYERFYALDWVINLRQQWEQDA